MAMVPDFEVMSDKLNLAGFCISENYA